MPSWPAAPRCECCRLFPIFRHDWADVLQRELQLGIGIHTGDGARRQHGQPPASQYGPRGTNVHLTSRVEAATKQLDCPLLVTEATARRLSNRFAAHRVCRARMPGFDRPIDLYSFMPAHPTTYINSPHGKRIAKRCNASNTVELKEAFDILATIDATLSEIPTLFLTRTIAARAFSRTHRRRSTDAGSESVRGVITARHKVACARQMWIEARRQARNLANPCSLCGLQSVQLARFARILALLLPRHFQKQLVARFHFRQAVAAEFVD